ncbi:hypothetical protein BGW36DRAFT_416389 [Talaromyces proteolyticus]|uniref:Uncharacterized protein n=1 Tax=Talaromyces proteolyticus TaxID=1131652 RepID=A0AAD4Q1X0_9EURO|nr:uncharacterized protein BGW36DRAFT_416389 [Talaromyces proteolyticus]KAH8698955.1 hypothetical protein BGW36DRAFT_416389 [Talaromyces proteolyticus]
MFGRRSRHTTKTTKPTLMTRLKGRNARTRTYKTEVTEHGGHHHHHHNTTTRTAPAFHHRRRPSLGDKVSGAILRMKGSLTRRPGEKAAGTRRMRGTDGRRSHRVY